MELSWPYIISLVHVSSCNWIGKFIHTLGPGPLLTKRTDVLPQNLTDRVPVKFAIKWKNLNPNLVASRPREISR